jgi:nucleoside-diphosphate-sugar epimerase
MITGATGFIGAQLVRLLAAEHSEVHAVVRETSGRWRLRDLDPGAVTLHVADLADSQTLSQVIERIQPETCIHLAWTPTPGHDLNSEANAHSLMMSLNLLRLLAQHGCKQVLIAGTCVEYDTDYGYLAETSPTKPRTLYAASKLALHVYAERYARTAGLEVAWLRFFYLYGPMEDPRRLVPTVVRRLLDGVPVDLTGGDQIKDYLHVEDAARAVLEVARSGLTGVVNIGSGQPVSVRSVVLALAGHLGRPDLLQFGRLPYAEHDPMFICANNRRLTSETGWRPSHGIDQGLKQTVEWWRSSQVPA